MLAFVLFLFFQRCGSRTNNRCSTSFVFCPPSSRFFFSTIMSMTWGFTKLSFVWWICEFIIEKNLPRRWWVSCGKLLPPHEMLWKHLAEDSAHPRETPSSPVRLIKMFTTFGTWDLISFKMHCRYPSNYFIMYIYILISGWHTPKTL